MGEYGAVYGRVFFLDATKKTTTATAELKDLGEHEVTVAALG